ncbi:hypothetical protein L4D20_19075 [Vibrio kyushuensis]|uniref:hypothetical protein n=1 Tax=Vibrio kyushuensis TaxID=2910249 RepID=UPI003D0FE24A
MRNRHLNCFFLLLSSLLPMASWSSDAHISGFGTVAYSYESEDDIGFMRDLSHPYNSSVNGFWLSDSRFGLQFDYSINNQWRTALQIIAKDRSSEEWGDVLEIAFLGYQPNESWDFRVGRVAPDAFWATETRNIDYGHNWVRPPLEVYSWLAFQSVDGIDVLYHTYSSNIDWYFGSQFGVIHTNVESSSGDLIKTTGSPLMSLSVKAVWDEWRIRTALIYTPNLSSSTASSTQVVLDQLNAVVALPLPTEVADEASSLANALVIEDEGVLYAQLGLEYFTGNWLVSSEVVSIQSEHDKVIIPSGIGSYLSVAYYTNGWSPYVIASLFSPDIDPQSAQSNWGSFDPALGYLQNLVIDNINTSRVDQQTWSVGVRWDLMSNIAIKAQVDFIEIAPNGYGLWANETSLNSMETKLELYTLSLNFIF